MNGASVTSLIIFTLSDVLICDIFARNTSVCRFLVKDRSTGAMALQGCIADATGKIAAAGGQAYLNPNGQQQDALVWSYPFMTFWEHHMVSVPLGQG